MRDLYIVSIQYIDSVYSKQFTEYYVAQDFDFEHIKYLQHFNLYQFQLSGNCNILTVEFKCYLISNDHGPNFFVDIHSELGAQYTVVTSTKTQRHIKLSI